MDQTLSTHRHHIEQSQANDMEELPDDSALKFHLEKDVDDVASHSCVSEAPHIMNCSAAYDDHHIDAWPSFDVGSPNFVFEMSTPSDKAAPSSSLSVSDLSTPACRPLETGAFKSLQVRHTGEDDQALHRVGLHGRLTLQPTGGEIPKTEGESSVPSSNQGTTSHKSTSESSNSPCISHQESPIAPFQRQNSHPRQQQLNRGSGNMAPPSSSTPATSIMSLSSESIPHLSDQFSSPDTSSGPKRKQTSERPLSRGQSDVQDNSQAEDAVRRLERSTSSNRRRSRQTKQKSPDGSNSTVIQKHTSVEGGCVGKTPVARSRPSRRATVGPAAQAAAQAAVQDSNLRIDTYGAAAYAGPTGARRAGKATVSPHSARSMPAMWEGNSGKDEASAHGDRSDGQQSWQPTSPPMHDSMSLQDFLKQPRGMAWAQHFQRHFVQASKGPSQSSNADSSALLQENIHSTPNGMPAPYDTQRDQSPSNQQTNSSMWSQGHQQPSHMHNVQQAMSLLMKEGIKERVGDPSLVQALQSAFVLGMQQLGLDNRKDLPTSPSDPVHQNYSGSGSGGAPSSPHGLSMSTEAAPRFSETPQHQHSYLPSNPQHHQQPHETFDNYCTVPQSAKHAHQMHEEERSTTDISLEQLFSSFAGTLNADEFADQTKREKFPKHSPVPNSHQRSSSTDSRPESSKASTTEPVKAVDRGRKGKPPSLANEESQSSSPKNGASKRKTGSISGPFNTTHLDDVIENVAESLLDATNNSSNIHEASSEVANVPGRYSSERSTSGNAATDYISKENLGRRSQAFLSDGQGRRAPEQFIDSDEIDAMKEDSDGIVDVYGDADADGDGNDDDDGEGEVFHRRATKGKGAATSSEANSKKLAERRRKRRESHNAVERRRRDHINERIAELASLLPEAMLLDAIAASTAGGNTAHIDLSMFAKRVPHSIKSEAVIDAASTIGPKSDLERQAAALAPVPAHSDTLAAAQAKPNKGIILTKACEYTRILHEFCERLRQHNRQLEDENGRLRDEVMLAGVRPPSTGPSHHYHSVTTNDSVPDWVFGPPSTSDVPNTFHREQSNEQQSNTQRHQPSFMELISLGVSSLAAMGEIQHQQRQQQQRTASPPPPGLAAWLHLHHPCHPTAKGLNGQVSTVPEATPMEE